MKQFYFLIFFILLAQDGLAQKQLKGVVYDAINNTPLAFVQIGLLHQKIGTLSDENGQFELNIKEIKEADTLLFTYLGYEVEKIACREFRSEVPILLKKKVFELPSSFIKAKAFGKVKKVGYPRTKAKRITTGWSGALTSGSKLKAIGERGTVIKLKKEALIKEVYCHIAQNDYDSVLLRLHIYKLENGLVGEELTKRNIYVICNKKNGWIGVPLEEEAMILEDDFIVTLEWLKYWGKHQKNGFLFSASFLGGRLFAREHFKDDDWIIKKGWHVGIYANVKPIKSSEKD